MMKTVLLGACLLTAFCVPLQAKTAATGGWLRCSDFQRDADGSWTARDAAPVELPGGNATIRANAVMPANGTYMGVQFAFLLDEQCGHAMHR